jgi:hypothetical protein
MISVRPRGVVATPLKLTCRSSTSRPIDGHKPIRFQGFMTELVPGLRLRSGNRDGRPNSAARTRRGNTMQTGDGELSGRA